jgi:hypothetical protein
MERLRNSRLIVARAVALFSVLQRQSAGEPFRVEGAKRLAPHNGVGPRDYRIVALCTWDAGSWDVVGA